MPRTNLTHDAHLLAVREGGGLISHATMLSNVLATPKAQMGNFGRAFYIAAVRAHYIAR